MKFMKYVVTLAFAFCAFTSITKAQTVQFLGGGSSALAQEIAQASYNLANVPAGQGCLWTAGTSSATNNPPVAGTDYFAFRDARGGIPNNGDENGKLFIAWNQNGSGNCAAPAAGYNIWAYMQLDSGIGDRCYFENDGSGHPGCLLFGALNGALGANQLNTQADVPAGAQLPAVILAALTNGAVAPFGHMFAAGTDIRPEDALFSIQRNLAPCNQLILRQFFNNVSYALFGGGYGSANPNVGVQIAGDPAYGGGVFNIVNFNIAGTDPITGAAVPAYQTNTIGAQPELILVAPIGDGAVNQMTDITNYTLSQYYAGNLGRTTDLSGVNVGEPMNFLVRETPSGTYSVFEYSNPQSTQFHTGQETGNCNAGGTVLQNPMHLATAPGIFAGAVNRIRALGTTNVVTFVDAAPLGTPVMGYAFWSAGNVAKIAHSRYLKVNGIDPLLPAGQYTGLVPGSLEAGAPPIANVNFAGLNAGDYPIWSPVRLVGPPGDARVAAMITALNNLNVLQNDFIKPANLAIWHSHFQINGQPANAANGPTFCAGGAVEAGGDAGGSTMLGINDTHFCADFGDTHGKLNLTF